MDEMEALIQRAKQACAAGNHRAARDGVREVTNRLEPLLAGFPPDDEDEAVALVRAVHRCGNLLVELGDLSSARSLLERALLLANELYEQDEHEARALNELGSCHYDLGKLLVRMGRESEARRLLLASIEYRQALCDHYGHPTMYAMLAMSISDICIDLGEDDEELYRLMDQQRNVLLHMRDAGMPLPEPLPEILKQLESWKAIDEG